MHSSGHFYYHDKKCNLKLSTLERDKTSAKLGQKENEIQKCPWQ